MNLTDVAKNSSLVIGALSAILLTPGVNTGYSNSYNFIPAMSDVKRVENNSTPFYYDVDRSLGGKSAYDEALDLFGEVRGFNEEENEMYEDLLIKLSESTEINYFDL